MTLLAVLGLHNLGLTTWTAPPLNFVKIVKIVRLQDAPWHGVYLNRSAALWAVFAGLLPLWLLRCHKRQRYGTHATTRRNAVP